MLSVTAISGYVGAWKEVLTGLGREFAEICTKECDDALTGTKDLQGHLTNYFNALKNLTIAMTVLMLIESILACVSCATWKRETKVTTHPQGQITVVTTTQQAQFVPVQVVQAKPVPAPVVVVAEPQAPKTEGPDL